MLKRGNADYHIIEIIRIDGRHRRFLLIFSNILHIEFSTMSPLYMFI